MTAPEHDPAACATCSGKRYRPDDPRPLYELLIDLMAGSPPIPPISPDSLPSSEGV